MVFAGIVLAFALAHFIILQMVRAKKDQTKCMVITTPLSGDNAGRKIEEESTVEAHDFQEIKKNITQVLMGALVVSLLVTFVLPACTHDATPPLNRFSLPPVPVEPQNVLTRSDNDVGVGLSHLFHISWS